MCKILISFPGSTTATKFPEVSQKKSTSYFIGHPWSEQKQSVLNLGSIGQSASRFMVGSPAIQGRLEKGQGCKCMQWKM